MKQQMYQQFVYKIESEKILSAKGKNLIITPKEARREGLIISLADSALLRMLDRLNGVDREATAARIEAIRDKIRVLNNSKGAAARNEKRRLYEELDNIQIKNDYIEVTMSKKSDFDKINKGFKINGIEFKRLVGTTNGVKKSTVVYCSIVNENGVHIYDELERMLNGGRNETKKMNPAKFEAYKSLACSSSVPVSLPKDILVVDDFVLNVSSKYIRLEDGVDGEPLMTEQYGEIELNASDGYGLMLPELAKRWSDELRLDYVTPGVCIRNLFCKGMIYVFDFQEFAQRYYDSSTITDVWGTVHNIEDVELILPVSVMKLWDSYKSLKHYLECCEKYNHTFAVTKTCDDRLENERTLNYQYIQSYELNDDEIMELVSPTVDFIKSTVKGDIDKTILFIRGACAKNYDFEADEQHLAKALMIAPELADDPYVVSVVNNMIAKKKRDLKIGKCYVHGNYALISGDPFAFCQKIFGCDVPDEEKGLLKAGEIYSKYWADEMIGYSKKVACFRSPMSCHNNIKVMNVVRDYEIDYWYQYMTTVNIINCHDTFYPALNGADNDGDSIMTTDNKILLRKWRDTPAILCVQKQADKAIITPENLAQSNKNGFGNDVGSVTNKVTAMYDVMSRFNKDSEQHKTMEYRIMCGQHFQQNAVDAVKGISCTPMPKHWHSKSSVKPSDDDSDFVKEFKEKNQELIADKKPYFMIYIYPDISKDYRKYRNSVDTNCSIQFKSTLSELLEKDNDELTEQERLFVENYYKNSPVTDGLSTMNRLCHIIEKEFERYPQRVSDKSKNKQMMELLKSGNSVNIKADQKKVLAQLYKEYQAKIKSLSAPETDDDERIGLMIIFEEQFRRECYDIYSNAEQLCDALLEICYNNNESKRFVWAMCGEQIVKNLLSKRGQYSYYIYDEDGEIEYRGDRYSKITVDLSEKECDINDYNE